MVLYAIKYRVCVIVRLTYCWLYNALLCHTLTMPLTTMLLVAIQLTQ